VNQPGGPIRFTLTPGFSMARTRRSLEATLEGYRKDGRSVALVPTMGYLHEGHLSLVDTARRHADAVVLSIFVNPLQFAPGEDLERYPRDLERDAELAMDRGANLVFAPSEGEMFPTGRPRIQVDPGELAKRLCGQARPHHFQGVATIVAKLFGLVRPDVAVFGRKDYQQALLIRTMVADLDLGVAVQVAPIMREPDGLAMSSRNAYLGEGEREAAAEIFQALSSADRVFRHGERNAESLRSRVHRHLDETPLLDPEYVELVDPQSLAPLQEAREGAVLAVAVQCGRARLIDNVVLGSPVSDPRLGETDVEPAG